MTTAATMMTPASVESEVRAASAPLLLEVSGLSARYGKVPALTEAALSLRAGQIVTVIGPNGAGKSTLLNAMMGAMPAGAAASGRIAFQGEDVSQMEVEERVARGLSLVPEKRELFTSMSVEDNLLLGAYKRRRNGESGYLDQQEFVYALFPRLKERRKQAAGTLSGGERQMLAVGSALMAKPQVLMLDEPSLGLAPLIPRKSFPSSASCATPAWPPCWWSRMRGRPCRWPITGMCWRWGRSFVKGRRGCWRRTRRLWRVIWGWRGSRWS